MPQPSTSIPNWASDATFTAGIETGIAPTLAFTNSEISQGLRPGRIVARKLNWLFRNITQWLAWHDEKLALHDGSLDAHSNILASHSERLNSLVPVRSFFSADGLWNKPANCLFVSFAAIGGGGGGSCGGTGTYRSEPGAGGGSGRFRQAILPAIDVPNQLYVIVGAAGIGGRYTNLVPEAATCGDSTRIYAGPNSSGPIIFIADGGYAASGTIGGAAAGTESEAGGNGGSMAQNSQPGQNTRPGYLSQGGVGGAGGNSENGGAGGSGGFGYGAGGGGAGGVYVGYQGVGRGAGGGAGGSGLGVLDPARQLPVAISGDPGWDGIGGNPTIFGGSGMGGCASIICWCSVS